jgi:hypothetical protein
MALMDFIKKQFIDIIEWTEDGDGVLAWRFPMEDREIQNGGSLTVRDSQMAVFVNEGKVADVFGPGRYTLTTATLPVLTYLQNWDKLFKSPFKSDVYFFSTRQQIDQRFSVCLPHLSPQLIWLDSFALMMHGHFHAVAQIRKGVEESGRSVLPKRNRAPLGLKNFRPGMWLKPAQHLALDKERQVQLRNQRSHPCSH